MSNTQISIFKVIMREEEDFLEIIILIYLIKQTQINNHPSLINKVVEMRHQYILPY